MRELESYLNERDTKNEIQEYKSRKKSQNLCCKLGAGVGATAGLLAIALPAYFSGISLEADSSTLAAYSGLCLGGGTMIGAGIGYAIGSLKSVYKNFKPNYKNSG